MKLYQIDVPVWATAYIKAESPEQALEFLKSDLCGYGIEVDGAEIDGRRYSELMEDEAADRVTLSPAMSVSYPHDPFIEEVEL